MLTWYIHDQRLKSASLKSKKPQIYVTPQEEEDKNLKILLQLNSNVQFNEKIKKPCLWPYVHILQNYANNLYGSQKLHKTLWFSPRG